ncbi:nucleoside diphosphate kinase, putative, partial [Trypanosoma cruzi]
WFVPCFLVGKVECLWEVGRWGGTCLLWFLLLVVLFPFFPAFFSFFFFFFVCVCVCVCVCV